MSTTSHVYHFDILNGANAWRVLRFLLLLLSHSACCVLADTDTFRLIPARYSVDVSFSGTALAQMSYTNITECWTLTQNPLAMIIEVSHNNTCFSYTKAYGYLSQDNTDGKHTTR